MNVDERDVWVMLHSTVEHWKNNNKMRLLALRLVEKYYPSLKSFPEERAAGVAVVRAALEASDQYGTRGERTVLAFDELRKNAELVKAEDAVTTEDLLLRIAELELQLSAATNRYIVADRLAVEANQKILALENK